MKLMLGSKMDLYVIKDIVEIRIFSIHKIQKKETILGILIVKVRNQARLLNRNRNHFIINKTKEKVNLQVKINGIGIKFFLQLTSNNNESIEYNQKAV